MPTVQRTPRQIEEGTYPTYKDRLEDINPQYRQYGKDLGALENSGVQTQLIPSLAMMPYLQMFGGLFPGSQGAISELLPQGTPFMSPLQYGPYGSIGRQANAGRQMGRAALAGRGLMGSGAESAFNESSLLGEAMMRQQATQQLMQQLPMLLLQAQQGGLQSRLLREQIGAMRQGEQPGYGAALGALGGAAAGMFIPGGGPMLAGVGSQVGGQVGGLF